VSELNARFAGASAADVITAAARELFPGQFAVVSSFGAESAALLSVVSDAAPETPVIFLDTGKLFAETLAHRDAVVAKLHLEEVRTIRPRAEDLAVDDADGDLHDRRSDLCCHIRKTLPLARALRGCSAWASGRKRFHGALRAELALFEVSEGRIKINPLANWTADDIAAEITRKDLPRHPLIAQGYASIGCRPCTTPVKAGEDARAGRWRDGDKTECGIHFSADGTVNRD